MGIRISHGNVKTAGQFGIEAGKGEQAARQAEITQASQAQADAAIVSETIRANARISQTIMDAQVEQEAREFQSFMAGESAKRAMAWEQEKTELRNQHQFDMQEREVDLRNQYDIEQELKAQGKIDTQKRALDAAVERGDISEDEAAREKLRIDVGVSGSQSKLFGKGDPIADAIRRAQEQGGRLDTPTASPTARAELSVQKKFPETFEAAKTEQAVSEAGGALREAAKSKFVTAGQKEAIDKLLKTPGVTQTEIMQATDALEARIAASAQQATSVSSAAARKASRTQTMGSFR